VPSATFHVRSPWRLWHLWAAVGLALLGFAVTGRAWLDIAQIALRDEESSHVLLVPVVFAWLVWVRRFRFRLCRPVGTWVGPLFIAVGGAIAMYGYGQAIQSFWHGGSVLVVLGCVLSILGRQVLVAFLPAIVVLIFIVPVPGRLRLEMAIPMQTITAAATQWMFDLLGLAVDRSGNTLSINGEQVRIVEACNGMRMIFTLVMVSYAYAFGTPLRWFVRLIIVGLSPLSAVVCNVLRLLPTIWMYGYMPDTVADPFHSAAGWLMVGVAFLLLMGILKLLKWMLIPVAPFTLAYE